ncbi:MAG TPA: phenylalanine 4-monooxygenase [Sphingobacterium sp.]|nr:phenylalanine 4-monooxygenase [Sphingobacterium sp.]
MFFEKINAILHIIYRYLNPYLRFIDFQKFKYVFWGCANVGLNWVLYFVLFNFVTEKQNISIFGIVTISPYIFSFLLSFVITFFSGFFLNCFIVFNENKNNGIYTMLGRYLFSNLGSLLINYLLLKLFVEQFLWYPTPSQILCTFIVTVYSFLMQKKFTFSLSLKEPN